MASYSNIKIEQGTSFDVVIDVINDDNTAYDLTDYDAKSQMKKSHYTSSFHEITASIYGDPVNGQVKLAMTPAQSNAIKAGRYVYDVVIYNNITGNVERVVEGIINLTPATTTI
jgi:hypothetical protein